MSLKATPYYELTCNGKLDNLRQPDCLAVSNGGFVEEDVVKAALERGWTESGKGHKCPGCSFTASAQVAAPVRKTRSPKGEQAAPAEAPQDSGFPQ